MSEFTRPPLNRHDRVTIKEPRDMGKGTVQFNDKGKYWIQLDNPYISMPLRKVIEVVRRTRNQIIKIS